MTALAISFPARADAEGLRVQVFKLLTAPPGAPPGVPLDYAAWMEHLVWLRGAMQAGLVESSDLDMEEITGLRILAEAADEVGRMRQCPRCGARTEAQLMCTCGANLKEAKGIAG